MGFGVKCSCPSTVWPRIAVVSPKFAYHSVSSLWGLLESWSLESSTEHFTLILRPRAEVAQCPILFDFFESHIEDSGLLLCKLAILAYEL